MKKSSIALIVFAFTIVASAASLAPTIKNLGRRPVVSSGIDSSLLRGNPTPQATPYWKPETWEVETKAVALAPGQVYALPLWVNPEWRNARLIGRFQAQGGSGNDIYACVTDKDGLTNLKNGHAAKIWYESGRMTVDTINAAIPGGLSYFTLSNKFSIFANKAVTFDLRIEYERLVNP